MAPDAPAVIPPATAARVVMATTKVESAKTALELTVSVPATFTSLAIVMVPETVRLLKVSSVESRVIVLLVPDIVTVLVPSVNTEPVPLVSQLPETDHAPDVRVMVPPAPVIVTSDTVTVEAFAVSVPVAVTVSVPAPDKLRLAVVSVPDTDVAVETSMAVDIVMVPETVRLANPLEEFRVETVFVVPLNVMVEVPFVKVVPVPLVFQFPDTDHEPEVSVMVPLVTLVMVTLETVTVLAFAVRVPPVWMVSVAPPDNARLVVASVPEIDSAFETSIAVDCVIEPEMVRL